MVSSHRLAGMSKTLVNISPDVKDRSVWDRRHSVQLWVRWDRARNGQSSFHFVKLTPSPTDTESTPLLRCFTASNVKYHRKQWSKLYASPPQTSTFPRRPASFIFQPCIFNSCSHSGETGHFMELIPGIHQRSFGRHGSQIFLCHRKKKNCEEIGQYWRSAALQTRWTRNGTFRKWSNHIAQSFRRRGAGDFDKSYIIKEETNNP